jgi:hypothetical protein
LVLLAALVAIQVGVIPGVSRESWGLSLNSRQIHASANTLQHPPKLA